MPVATKKTYFRDSVTQPWAHHAPSDHTFEPDTLANLKRRYPPLDTPHHKRYYTETQKVEERYNNGFWCKDVLTFH